MSQPPPPLPGPPQAAPPSGTSGMVKIVLALVIGGTVAAAICCGALGLVGFQGARLVGTALEQAYSPDPDETLKRTSEIAEIQLPNELRPAGSFNLRVPVTNLPLFVAAWHTSDKPWAFLALAELHQDNQEASRDALHEVLKTYLKSHEPDDIHVEHTEEREYVIRDKPAWFEIARGRGTRHPDQEYVRVLGGFPGQHGPALFVYLTRSDTYDEAQVTHIIESIR